MNESLPGYRRFSIKNFEVRDPADIDRELTKYDVDGDDVISIITNCKKVYESTYDIYYKVFYKCKCS